MGRFPGGRDDRSLVRLDFALALFVGLKRFLLTTLLGLYKAMIYARRLRAYGRGIHFRLGNQFRQRSNDLMLFILAQRVLTLAHFR